VKITVQSEPAASSSSCDAGCFLMMPPKSGPKAGPGTGGSGKKSGASLSERAACGPQKKQGWRERDGRTNNARRL